MEHESPRFCFLSCRMGIDDVPDEGVPKVQHVDAYLVGATSVQDATYQGTVCRRVVVKEFVIRDGRFPTAWIDDSHFQSVDRVASDIRENRAFRRVRATLHDSQVDFLCIAISKLCTQGMQPLVSLSKR